MKLLQDLPVKFVFAEVLLFFLVVLFLGMRLHPQDPLLVKSAVNPLMLLVAVITLYYGWWPGLLATGISGVAMFYLYHPFPKEFFLWELLTVLVCGEFYTYWRRKIEYAEEEASYLRLKLREKSALLKVTELSTALR